ncbi:hypothetical protein EGW08_000628 [Elysia chlorotica]|uniref:VWFA domain-containing protein n=1 Tax=Elysia chlorotica TaxID=188477 RepID=A0A3S1A119_ELYCH|nr:hypothetical protein EGW08_000628 [Elysia chlorotica]
MVGILFLVGIISQICSNGLGSFLSDPNFRNTVRRALDAQPGSGDWSQTVGQCRDQDQCETVEGICGHEDTELVSLLCPIKCGHCVCEDSLSTGGNCSSLVPDICSGELAQSLCAKSCHVCGAPEEEMTTTAPCMDNVVGLECADLDPCSDPIGMIVCSRHCGICQDITIPTSPVPAVTCAPPWTTIDKIGCYPAEIVFLMEYARSDSLYDVYWEGSFIREIIEEWPISPDYIRIGLVVYHDTVEESIHIGDFDNKADLQRRIYEITSSLRPSGRANLANALNFTRQNSFVGARPDVERIVVPIVHEMHAENKNDIPAAAVEIKDDCMTIIGLIVNSPSIDYTIVSQMVSRPVDQFFYNYRNFFEMETGAKYFYSLRC